MGDVQAELLSNYINLHHSFFKFVSLTTNRRLSPHWLKLNPNTKKVFRRHPPSNYWGRCALNFSRLIKKQNFPFLHHGLFLHISKMSPKMVFVIIRKLAIGLEKVVVAT